MIDCEQDKLATCPNIQNTPVHFHTLGISKTAPRMKSFFHQLNKCVFSGLLFSDDNYEQRRTSRKLHDSFLFWALISMWISKNV